MKVREILEVTKKEFYDLIMDSALQGIQEQNPKARRSDLKLGYCYKIEKTGKLGSKSVCRIKILTLVESEQYGVEVEDEHGVTTLRYDLEDVADGVCVNYSEEYVGKKKSFDLNYKLMSMLYKRKAKKRFINQLCAMEEYIKNNRVK